MKATKDQINLIKDIYDSVGDREGVDFPDLDKITQEEAQEWIEDNMIEGKPCRVLLGTEDISLDQIKQILAVFTDFDVKCDFYDLNHGYCHLRFTPKDDTLSFVKNKLKNIDTIKYHKTVNIHNIIGWVEFSYQLTIDDMDKFASWILNNIKKDPCPFEVNLKEDLKIDERFVVNMLDNYLGDTKFDSIGLGVKSILNAELNYIPKLSLNSIEVNGTYTDSDSD